MNFNKLIARNLCKRSLLTSTGKSCESAQNFSRSFSLSTVDNFFFRTTRRMKHAHFQHDAHVVNSVYADSGALLPMPKWYKLGMFKLFLMMTASLALGAMISKSFAEFLEDNEIFVPEEEDD